MKKSRKIRKIDKMVNYSRQLRESFLQDKYRPGYHFTIPEDLGLPGDPNGAFYANGRYHLMYLYKRINSGFCWGHISSVDLLHWRHHPDAIGPGGGDDGCFSGGAFVDDDGTAYLTYWKLKGNKGIGIAKSLDNHYDKWSKFTKSAIPATKWGVLKKINLNTDQDEQIIACADPSNIWKKDGVYYMQTGNLIVLNDYGRDKNKSEYQKYQGDWVDLFKSTDLENWEYLHRFYENKMDFGWTDESEDDMCPSFLPLPSSPDGGEMSGKYLQIFIAHNKGCQYYIGEYDKDRDKFIPEKHGRMTWIDNTYFAPEALIDNKGRQIMWSWLLDNPESERKAKIRGWSGVYGLPRILWQGEDGNLKQKVPPEFENLRYNMKKWNNISVSDGEKWKCDTNNNLSCEIELIIKPNNTQKIGIIVCASPDFTEETRLYYDSNSKSLVFDSSKSSKDNIGRCVVEKAPFALKNGEILTLRIFIDKCVLEIYANDTQAICRRVFTTLNDSTGIYLFSEGGIAEFENITAWEMMPSNPY